MTTLTKIRLVALGNLWMAFAMLAAFIALGWWLYQHIDSLFWLSLMLIGLAATLCTLMHSLWVVLRIVSEARMCQLLRAWAESCNCPDCTAKREAAKTQPQEPQ